MGDGSGIFVLFIILAIVFSIVGRLMDNDRITQHVEERGGRLVEKKWAPFGTGWYGDNNRIYTVRYLDRDGNEHQATCKTNLMSGVYWTDDEIVRYGEGRESPRTLKAENERLRREIERLKGESS